jgi:hypothetical protein
MSSSESTEPKSEEKMTDGLEPITSEENSLEDQANDAYIPETEEAQETLSIQLLELAEFDLNIAW